MKNKNLYDFKYYVDILSNSGKSAGVIFRMKDPYNFYAFEFNQKKGYKKLFKSINGEIYLFKYLVNAKSKYPPSLIELLLRVTGNDEESKIFIENNFYNSNPMIENQEQHKSIFLIK